MQPDVRIRHQLDPLKLNQFNYNSIKFINCWLYTNARDTDKQVISKDSFISFSQKYTYLENKCNG